MSVFLCLPIFTVVGCLLYFLAVHQEALALLCLLFSLRIGYSVVHFAEILNTAVLQVYASLRF